MTVTDEQKREQIAIRREAPELNLHGATLDRDLAIAAGDEHQVADAERRIKAAKAQLEVLDGAEDELDATS